MLQQYFSCRKRTEKFQQSRGANELIQLGIRNVTRWKEDFEREIKYEEIMLFGEWSGVDPGFCQGSENTQTIGMLGCKLHDCEF